MAETDRRLTSAESERALIGSLLIDPALIPLAQEVAKPEDFVSAANAEIYRAILKAGVGADYLSVPVKLTESGKLGDVQAEVGDPSDYLMDCATSLPTALNGLHYAETVAELGRRRSLLAGLGALAKKVYAGEDYEGALLQLKTERAGRGLPRLTDAIIQYRVEREAEQDGRATNGILTGIRELDALTNGWRSGQLIVVAGATGGGKTTLMLQCAGRAAKAGFRTLYESLEMNEAEIMRKLVANVSGVDTSHAALPRMNDEAWQKETDALNTISRWPLTINYEPGATLGQIATAAYGMGSRGGVDLIVIDYIQIMTPPVGTKNETRATQIGNLTRELKALAGHLRCPIIIGSQLNREAAEVEPQLHHLKESGSIEQDANVVLMLHDPKVPSAPALRMLHVRKSRSGSVGSMQVLVHWPTSRIGGVQNRIEF